MRQLTIRRDYNEIAKNKKTQVYVEDEYGEVKVRKINCHRLGEIKNGEEKSFGITEDAVKIITMSSVSSRKRTADYYQLPAGNEDVTLSGCANGNLIISHAFRFNDNYDNGAIENRRQAIGNGVKRMVLWIVVAQIVLGIVLGVILGVVRLMLPPQEKAFTCDDMTITLTDHFYKMDPLGHYMTISSSDVSVFIDYDPFSKAPSLRNYSPERYAETIIRQNDLDSDAKEYLTLTYFSYYGTSDSGVDYEYYAFVYKTDDGFWLVQFACEKADSERVIGDIIKYAESVRFDDDNIE